MRQMLRARFEDSTARDAQSAHLCKHILESSLYEGANLIGAYIPMHHEADITSVLRHALTNGKKLVLPLCGVKDNMSFRIVESLDTLKPNRWGIPEPDLDAPVIMVEDIDLLLVPLEGIDSDGYRLGKGGGYYDKVLHHQSVFTLGCALTWQWVDLVPREVHDVSLCACADENGIHLFGTTERKEVYSNGQETED